MPFDPLVTNAGRLRILTALAVEQRQEFVNLRRQTQLTDGNLAAHAKRLSSAGLIQIDKEFREGKPVTSYVLTAAGRQALESHARRLFAAISHRRTASPSPPQRQPTAITPASPPSADRLVPAGDIPAEPAVLSTSGDDDDWVD
jgi:DNA-binding MarR family transcriptional regulator